ncbi:rhodanese/Cell cycle control phosphatasesuperfamily protein [Striga asiatica]|uniref:Rhodanese/Cell cycle control phosphatasesuperfamily protein n=1 Tax=Striga asiatica TaxID=4170 RepID=A0A5A7PGZ5_STRAF|nr:rhodanese/Cell cycle control phosphatasesuperfamily protein [Striga asiatica]
MVNNNRVRQIEEEVAVPLLQKTSESDSIHPRTQIVTTKFQRLRCTCTSKGRARSTSSKRAWPGGTRTSSRCARFQYGFKSIYAFTPGSGRGRADPVQPEEWPDN